MALEFFSIGAIHDRVKTFNGQSFHSSWQTEVRATSFANDNLFQESQETCGPFVLYILEALEELSDEGCVLALVNAATGLGRFLVEREREREFRRFA